MDTICTTVIYQPPPPEISNQFPSSAGRAQFPSLARSLFAFLLFFICLFKERNLRENLVNYTKRRPPVGMSWEMSQTSVAFVVRIEDPEKCEM
jgi:hypothetical protein